MIKFLRGESCIYQHLLELLKSPEHIDLIENVCTTLINKTRPFISTNGEDHCGKYRNLT